MTCCQNSIFKQIVLASSNAGKLREFQAFFKPYQIEVISQKELGVSECAEPYFTFLENALEKARHASRETGLPALADDSGICATALNGAPGVHSARFAGGEKSEKANNQKLVQELANHNNKEVWYACTLVLVRSFEDPLPIVADGIWQGLMVDTPKGENGFGYDPHFFLPQYQQTAAELTPTIKNRISHRGKALTTLMHKLDELYESAGLNIPEEAFNAKLTTPLGI